MRQTIQMEEARAADCKARVLASRSVRIGHEPSTTNPARISAETSVSQASGDLLAKTITNRPSSRGAAWNRENARAMPSL